MQNLLQVAPFWAGDVSAWWGRVGAVFSAGSVGTARHLGLLAGLPQCSLERSAALPWGGSGLPREHASPRPGLRQASFVSGFSFRVYFPGTGASALPGRWGGASGYIRGSAEKFFPQRAAHSSPGSSSFKPARKADACPPLRGMVGVLSSLGGLVSKSRTSWASLSLCWVSFHDGLFQPTRFTSGSCVYANRGARWIQMFPSMTVEF